jgi:hypothetical protein
MGRVERPGIIDCRWQVPRPASGWELVKAFRTGSRSNRRASIFQSAANFSLAQEKRR